VHPARDPGSHERSSIGARRKERRYFARRRRRWLHPPRTLSPTRAGWFFFALTFGVGFAALNTGNNLLYLVLSLMLAFLVLSGVLSESALRGIALRRLVPRELYAERDGWVSVEIHNRQRRAAAYAVVVEDRLERGDAELAAGRCMALRIEAGGSERRSYRLRPDRRGELAFAGFVVSTRFPFGLFSKSLTIEARERALVYPAVDPAPIPRHFGGVREAGESVPGPRGRGADVSGVREYERGDPPRRIAWRASLRSRALWVRDVESEHEGEVEVRLRTAQRPADDTFERDVRGSASEAAALLARGLRVGLRTDADWIAPAAGTAQRARLLGFLARVAPGSREDAGRAQRGEAERRSEKRLGWR
jgi:uncharacterized protein (DUF58 family)